MLAGLDPDRMDRLPDHRRARPRSSSRPAIATGTTTPSGRRGRASSSSADRRARPRPRWTAVDGPDRRCLLPRPGGGRGLAFDDFAAAAHAHGLPVLVDASMSLPPRANLRRFVTAGADLVAFSGGKTIRGPQASGFLAGRADLIVRSGSSSRTWTSSRPPGPTARSSSRGHRPAARARHRALDEGRQGGDRRAAGRARAICRPRRTGHDRPAGRRSPTTSPRG